MRMRTTRSTPRAQLAALGIALPCGLLLTFLILAGAALLITKKDINEKYYTPILAAAVCLGGCLTAAVFTGKLKMKGILSGLLSGGCHAALIYLICALFNGGLFSARLLCLLLLSVALSAATGILIRNLRR